MPGSSRFRHRAGPPMRRCASSQDDDRRSDDHAGARLHLADLVHAVTLAVGVLQAALLGSALAMAPSVSACGYHDAGSINRGMLNWAYPNALYVTSAVWKAQLDGLLSRDDRPAATRALLGYGTAVKELGQLRDGLSLVRDHGRNDPTISLVLIGPMLWARLAPANTRLRNDSPYHRPLERRRCHRDGRTCHQGLGGRTGCAADRPGVGLDPLLRRTRSRATRRVLARSAELARHRGSGKVERLIKIQIHRSGMTPPNLSCQRRSA